ncbi:growth-regulating factor 1 isoform X2 [Macadamia integrifolia]|uniref:growth-regulating factor 1 isoform X2 n=1 Tax=Macadamia integrifolia TaxID=60698 RepID=UPI001C4F40E6|nr:growth-regulating factor 1 isoform X2 [Macadamia integrifolia]
MRSSSSHNTEQTQGRGGQKHHQSHSLSHRHIPFSVNINQLKSLFFLVLCFLGFMFLSCFSSMMNTRHGSPFTTCQWQELEHQALIFKYMVSGVPIPSDLIFPIKRSLDSLLSSRLFPHQPTGWGCFQVDSGRKTDPEPGRCRRTDGKKWRCSKETYPGSKYCERHMHRGRNRSRKPVEVIASNPSTTISSIARNQSTPSPYSLSSLSSSVAAETHNHHHPYHNASPYPFHYPHSSRPPGIGFSSPNNSPHLHLDTGSYCHADKDYRYSNGLKRDVDEIAFSEVLETVRSVPDSPFDNPWRFTPLRTSCSSLTPPKQKSHSALQDEYTQLQLQNFTDISKHQQERENQEQHRFVFDTDIKSERPMKVEKEEGTQQTLLHFFDEWPPKNREYSTTQLSISIPVPSPDLPVSNSRTQNGG